MIKIKKLFSALVVLSLVVASFMGCGNKATEQKEQKTEKTFVFGDTTFNAENEEANINPHDTYCGWPCVRYGVGETLFKFDNNMKLQPWIAESYENIDENTWTIDLKDNVKFSNGKACDAQVVKACLEDLVSNHERAAADLDIESIEADGLKLTIKTNSPRPAFMNSLCDPYGCIIDVEAGDKDGIVVGTGPFVATELVTGDHIYLEKNKDYWNGKVKLDKIQVVTFTDGDTLALSLQNGDIDGAYGMAYASYPLFENDGYKFNSTATSRSFYCQMNYNSNIIRDDAVRKAIAMGIDKKSFVDTLLDGYGYTAKGVFPDNFKFGDQNITTENYDPEAAKQVLEVAGWKDTNGDGIREKGGKKLSIKWLTYPSRQELPLLAESAQATLKEIGIDVQLNITADHGTIVSNKDEWDVYAAAFVTCGTGDPMYFFDSHCLDESPKNRGGYHSDNIQSLADEMNKEFDADARGDIAVKMQQQIVDDNAFVFVSFLKMSMITKSNVTGLNAHPSDYYEFTADLDIQ